MSSDADESDLEPSQRLYGERSAGGGSLPSHEPDSLPGAQWRNRAKVYGCHLMASWGDRMWLFAIGLYMIKLYPESLKLTAIYGITLAGSILLFGSFIGAWIDRTCRITAARAALIVQNSSVALCALLLVCVIAFNDRLTALGPWANPLSQGLIVFVANIAGLASEASRIILEKDWIVVIAAEDRSLLASYNSVLRAIDLGSNILAPTSVGFVMSWMSSIAAAFFLCVWNVVSMVLEYFLLTNIFKTFPDLAVKSKDLRRANAERRADEIECVGAQDGGQDGSGVQGWMKKAVFGWVIYFRHDVFAAGLGLALLYMTVLGFDHITTAFAYSQGVQPWILGMLSGLGALNGMIGALCFPMLCRRFGLRRTGVLGFSLETVMLSASLLSIVLPGSPFKWYTNEPMRPNQAANWTQAGLDLLVTGRERSKSYANATAGAFNDTDAWDPVATPTRFPKSVPSFLGGMRKGPAHLTMDGSIGFDTAAALRRLTASAGGAPNGSDAFVADGTVPVQSVPPLQMPTAMYSHDGEGRQQETPSTSATGSNISIVAFLGGIIAARFGLWVADLTVTQVLQEQVREDQRGIINGVQTSMNQLLDLVKFVLVVMLPETEKFAFLIIASYLFVCMGWLSFMVYCIQTVHTGAHDEDARDEQANDGKLRGDKASSPPNVDVGGQTTPPADLFPSDSDSFVTRPFGHAYVSSV